MGIIELIDDEYVQSKSLNGNEKENEEISLDEECDIDIDKKDFAEAIIQSVFTYYRKYLRS